QRLNPTAEPWRRLDIPRVLELRLLASDDFTNRRARHRKRPHDLLDWAFLLEIGATYLANLVHAHHPHPSFPAGRAKGKDADTNVRGGRYWKRNRPLRGSLLQAILQPFFHHRKGIAQSTDGR